MIKTLKNFKLFLFSEWFYPAFRAGGPITSNVNLCKALENDIQMNVLTGDRDLLDTAPFVNLTLNTWIRGLHRTNIYYLSLKRQNIIIIDQLLRQSEASVIYLTGMFSIPFTIYPLILLRLGRIQASVVLSPKGMLKPSALQFKSAKKKIFLSLFRLLGLHKRVHFHATDANEVRDIQSVFGKRVRIFLIPHFPGTPPSILPKRNKSANTVSILFVGRIHPIKRLDFAIDCLRHTQNEVQFYVVGNPEDTAYHAYCIEKATQLPANIRVQFVGERSPEALTQLLPQHHFFLLPTQGENFGHAIFEAMSAGLPVIISDQTPWRNLETQKVGWDIPLSEPERFVAAIERAARMDQAEYEQWSRAAHHYALDFIQNSNLKERYIEMFSAT